MGLKSRIFKGDPVFEACLVRDNAHITPGAVGKHVGKIHTALFRLDNLDVSNDERKHRRYGHSTVKAVLAYKDNKKRKIINHSYESHVDPIVGKMTIAWLDREMFEWENNPEGTADMIEHRASPKPPPRGRRLEDGLHDYAGMTADEAYRNAQSYQAYCFPESLGKPPDKL